MLIDDTCYTPEELDNLMLIPESLLQVAKVFAEGNKKEGRIPGDWRNKNQIVHLHAAHRHYKIAKKVYSTENQKIALDEETGLPHLAHAIARLLMALTYDDNNEGEK